MPKRFLIVAGLLAVANMAGASATAESGAGTGAPAAATYLNIHVTAATKFYPRNELVRGVTGCVLFALTFGPDGYPLVLGIARSWPPGTFDAAALAAARGFRIHIANRNGNPPDADALRKMRFFVPMIYSMSGTKPGGDELAYRCGSLTRRVLIVSAASAASPQKITIRPALKVVTAGGATMAPPADTSEPTVEAAGMLLSDLVTMPLPPGKTLRDGWVEVGFCVGADGRATHATVSRSSRHGLYDQAALAALATWTFVPRRVFGKAVATCGLWYSIPVVARSELQREPVALQPGPTVVNPHYLDNAQELLKLHRGTVTLRFCVDADGSLDDIEIVEPGSSRPFAAAAIDVLYSWQFLPREVNGKPVRACNGEQTLHFLAGYDMLNHHLIQVRW